VDYEDRGLAAVPKLVGGPRYSRPPVGTPSRLERPPDPDDLPLVAERTPEEDELARELGIDAPTVTMAVASPVATASPLTTASGLTAMSVDAGGHPSTHPNGSWSAGSGTMATKSPLPRRGLGGLLRGRSDRSGAS